MGKSFWVILCLFGLGLFATIFATFAVEEYRWQSAVNRVDEMIGHMETMSAATTRLIKDLHQAGEQAKAKEMEERQKDQEKIKEITLRSIKRDIDTNEMFWKRIPFVYEVLDKDRSGNSRWVLFSGLSLVFAVFVAIAAVKTKKRFSKEAAELMRQRNEIENSSAALKEREQKLRREQERLSADSAALEKLRSEFEDQRRRFSRQVAKFRHEHPESEDEGPAHLEDSTSTGALQEAFEIPDPVSIKPEVTTLAPWKFWVTFSQNDPGQLLPQEKGEFIAALKSALKKAGYPRLKMELVFKRFLVWIKKLESPQRMGEVGYTNLEGWRKFRVTRKHRFFFLRIGPRAVRFLPMPRGEAYRRNR